MKWILNCSCIRKCLHYFIIQFENIKLLTSVYLKWFLCTWERKKTGVFFEYISPCIFTQQTYSITRNTCCILFFLFVCFFKLREEVGGHLSVSPWVHRSEGLLLFSSDWPSGGWDLPPVTQPDRKDPEHNWFWSQ